MPFNNLDSTAAQISRMTPQQRQQFAQMHKADPIMMSLVSFVQNQDEAMRAAQMAKMTGQEKPKVVDQVIASINPPPPQAMPQGMPQQGMPQGMPPQGMPPQAAQQLPENTGIAALPAPNMQQMADGGITGYQDDLYIPDDSDARMGNGGYNFPPGESVIRMAEGTPEEMFTNQQDEDRQLADFDAASKLYQMERQPAPTQAQPRSMPAPSAQPSKRPMTGPTAAPTAEEYQAQIKQLRGTPQEAVDPWAAQTAEVSAAKVAAAQEESRGFKEDIAKLGLARKGQEERLGKRESELTKSEEKNSGLALLQAGLSMMQSKGRGLSGIAEGAGVGLNAYKAGMDKINLAKEKIDEARDQIEQYRRNEDMLTSKEARALKAKESEALVSAKQNALEGVKQAFGFDSATSLQAIQLAASDARAQQENATKLKAAGISANAPSGEIQRLTALGKGDIAKGVEIDYALKAKALQEQTKPPSYDQLVDNAQKMADSVLGLKWIGQLNKAAKDQGKPPLTQPEIINLFIKSQMENYAQSKVPPAATGTQAPATADRPPLSAFMK